LVSTVVFFIYLAWALRITFKIHRVISKYESKFGVINNNTNAEKYRSVKDEKNDNGENKCKLSKEKKDLKNRKEAIEKKVALIVKDKDEFKNFRERREDIKNKNSSKDETIPKVKSSTCICACNCSDNSKEQPM